MKHVGDITKLNGAELPIVDIITGGSPCQDLSVAGKREGLAGERSGLFMEQIRLIKEMREHDRQNRTDAGSNDDFRLLRPRYMVWENVPGAFSSNKGEDFRCVLEETARIINKDAVIPKPEGGRWTPSGCIMGEGWSIAWRVHDAQFWGVPQRRKRIALVADFGGETAPEILFERKGVSGDIEQSGETGQGIAATPKGDAYQTISFQERAGKPGGGVRDFSYNMNAPEPCPRSTTNTYCIGGGQVNDAVSPSKEVPKTLNCMDDTMKILTQGGMIVLEGNGQRDSHKGDGYKESDTMYTLNTVEQHAVCVSQDAYDKYSESDQSATIKQSGGIYGGGAAKH